MPLNKVGRKNLRGSGYLLKLFKVEQLITAYHSVNQKINIFFYEPTPAPLQGGEQRNLFSDLHQNICFVII